MIYFNTVPFLNYLPEIIIIVLNIFVEIVESELRRGGEADCLSVPEVIRFTVLFKNNEF